MEPNALTLGVAVHPSDEKRVIMLVRARPALDVLRPSSAFTPVCDVCVVSDECTDAHAEHPFCSDEESPYYCYRPSRIRWSGVWVDAADWEKICKKMR